MNDASRHCENKKPSEHKGCPAVRIKYFCIFSNNTIIFFLFTLPLPTCAVTADIYFKCCSQINEEGKSQPDSEKSKIIIKNDPDCHGGAVCLERPAVHI